jgi:hypothetical protein
LPPSHAFPPSSSRRDSRRDPRRDHEITQEALDSLGFTKELLGSLSLLHVGSCHSEATAPNELPLRRLLESCLKAPQKLQAGQTPQACNSALSVEMRARNASHVQNSKCLVGTSKKQKRNRLIILKLF